MVSESLEPRTGPIARVTGFCKALQGVGHNVVLVSPGTENRDTSCRGLRIIRYRANTRIGRYIGMVRCVEKTLKGFDPDVVQVTSYYAPIVEALAHIHSTPVISDYHASMRVMERSLTTRLVNAAVEFRALQSADMTIVPTHVLSSYLSSRYGKNIAVVGNCIDLDEFNVSEVRESVRQVLSLREGVKVVFFHGSLYPENVEALTRLVEIVDSLNMQGVPTKALVAGNLPRVSGDSVRYLGYRVDLARCIGAADLAILPVEISEMGVRSRVVEYLACGLPVVTTPSGSTEMGEAIERGVVTVARNIEGLTTAARRILELSPDEYHALRLAARKFAETHFSMSRAARDLEEVYSMALGGSGN